uniref:Riboflavin synthase n=1 Tax=Aureoumbra lagunensis TaxID=44058 RepID=A0A7S3NDD5_9STRA|mmetsp:Transcript_22846/g.29606  ORF Transcript_22846/g.29606 Transcript_22846/m.29606 type:complete len:279 (-) Transcript_22846:124-960(-)
MKVRFEAWLLLLVCWSHETSLGLVISSNLNKRRRATRSTIRMVFSGIIEEMGTVVSLRHRDDMTLWDGSIGEGTEMIVKGSKAVEDAYIGCSIAVNGVCLTATHLNGEEFTVGLSPETLRRTTLGKSKTGDRINLERSLRAEDRNSGHYVQGHVDGTARIAEMWQEDDSLWIRLKPPAELMPFIVPKGYIAVDGTSLTVCDVDSDSFTLMLVEHTQKCIILPSKLVGDKCNLEVDVMAKYAQNALGHVAALSAKVQELEERILVLESNDYGTECTGLD